MEEAKVLCPKCKNDEFKKHDYSQYVVKGGLVKGWKLVCLKCGTSYIMDYYAYEDLKEQKLKNIEAYAQKFAELLEEEAN